MTARVLVVDDVLSNVKLLEAKLAAEYFEVITACSGEQALARVAADLPDIVLLDVMLPDIDGFEVCRRIKANPKTAHVPVAMVTAPNRPADRVTGLEAGADDFLIKPVNDTALFARIRSLVRLKMMTDELRMREETGHNMGLADAGAMLLERDPSGRILEVEDRSESVAWFRAALEPKNEVVDVSDFDEALTSARGGDFDLFVVSLGIRAFDGLKLCAQLRSMPEARNTPVLVLVNDGENRKLTQAIDIGVNDYLMRPMDRSELLARVRTQLRKKHYADRLRHNMQRIIEMAIADRPTDLRNHASSTAGYDVPDADRVLYQPVKHESQIKVMANTLPQTADVSLTGGQIVRDRRSYHVDQTLHQPVKRENRARKMTMPIGGIVLGLIGFLALALLLVVAALMGNVLAVIAAYLVFIIAFRIGVALICGPKVTPNGESWLHRNFARSVPSHTFWTLIIPIGGAVMMGTYSNPPVPWLFNFGYCLSSLGYTLGGILLLIRAPFEVLGLHKRSSILIAAIGFFVVGTVILNRGLVAS